MYMNLPLFHGEIIFLPLQSAFQKHLFFTWTLQKQKEVATFKSIKAEPILITISKMNKSLLSIDNTNL